MEMSAASSIRPRVTLTGPVFTAMNCGVVTLLYTRVGEYSGMFAIQ